MTHLIFKWVINGLYTYFDMCIYNRGGLLFSKEHNFTSEEFSRLPTLRLLELEGGNLVGDFKNFLLSFKWFSWCHCPSDLQVINLCLQNLVVLKLSDSKIPENWNGWGPCLANHDLKVIHLIKCCLSTTPNFSTCLKLRILVFAKHYPESPQISSSIGKLERLKRLEIIADRIQQSKLSGSPYFDLCIVPSTICHLKNLSSLKLEGLHMQELHPSIGELAGLTCLSLMHCRQLRKLPYSIGKLRSLLLLNVYNTRIRELPNSIGDLKMLEKMNLGCTKIRGLPKSVGGLQSLLDLNLRRSKITTLPASIGYLKRLKCLYMLRSKIRELPNSIGDLKSLEEMHLGYTQIRELPNSIGGLESLLNLHLCGKKITKLPACIGRLKRLKHLSMISSKIRELPNSIGDLKSLLPLYLLRLELEDVKSPIVQPLPSKLRYFDHLILGRYGSREIVIEQLESLRRLNVEDCKSLVKLGLSSLGWLQELIIRRCPKLMEIRDLREMESLKVFDIETCSSIERLPKLSELYKLIFLGICDCRSLQWSTESSPELSKHGLLKLSHCESLQGAVPNEWRCNIHACPLLGEYGDLPNFCEWCWQSKRGPRARMRALHC
ncbi:hypothetical protein BT93_C1736 [Corymbia citriodora subsp. variegata]|nr:hypothetical protein BT93_C1736 [Corymbia citriodora subsp. variegata]